jgi:AraC-like DNA-binding protein
MPDFIRKSSALISIIQDLSNLDVVLLGKDGQILDELGRHNIPNELFFGADEIQRIGSRLSYGEATRCVNAVTGAGLSYLVFRYHEDQGKEGMLFIGPFLVMPVPKEAVNQAVLKCRIPLGDKPSIESLYSSIPHVGKDYGSNLGLAVRALMQDSLCPLETIDFQAEDGDEAPELPAGLSMRDKNRIKDFFVLEKILRGAVQAGNPGLFHSFSKEGNYFNYFKFKVTEDLLRAAKNMNIGYNAMLRLAAIDGGANPILVHTLTWKYVRIAQAAHSVEELMKTQNAMADDFIALVRERRLMAYSAKLREVLEYIDLNLNKSLSLKELADYAGMSAPNLAYYFRKELGSTCLEYMAAKRVEEACILLNDSSLSIKEISAMVGFCDASHFIKVFREARGQTPKQYRQAQSLEAEASVTKIVDDGRRGRPLGAAGA